MAQSLHRPPVKWKQLCAIARALLDAAPTMDDAEWKERIKIRVTALGYTYPAPPLSVRKAMAAVEGAMEKRGHPRQAPLIPSPPRRVAPNQIDPPWRAYDRGQPRWTSIGVFIEDLKISIRDSRH